MRNNPVLSGLKKIKRSIDLSKYFFEDFNVYNASAFYQTTSHTHENLRAILTLNYHAIEKGLSHKNLRLGFGKKALTRLYQNIVIYNERGFPSDDERYQSALSCIDKYIKIHDDKGYDISDIKRMFKPYLVSSYIGEGGTKRILKKDKINNLNINFKSLAKNRHTIREFSNERIKLEKIEHVINIALSTPSACNRQPWRVYAISDTSYIKKIIEKQGGLKGYQNHPPMLLVITSDVQYYGGPIERNAAYIDGGLFSMSVLYGLEYEGFAACTLNASLNLENEKYIKELVEIKQTEKIIMFIAVGNMLDEVKVPISTRDKNESILKYID